MKTGIELIAQERQEQIEKHGRTVESDVKHNSKNQLSIAARALLTDGSDMDRYDEMPNWWDDNACEKMCFKPYKERLIIAGALIAAELDRLQNI